MPKPYTHHNTHGGLGLHNHTEPSACAVCRVSMAHSASSICAMQKPRALAHSRAVINVRLCATGGIRARSSLEQNCIRVRARAPRVWSSSASPVGLWCVCVCISFLLVFSWLARVHAPEIATGTCTGRRLSARAHLNTCSAPRSRTHSLLCMFARALRATRMRAEYVRTHLRSWRAHAYGRTRSHATMIYEDIVFPLSTTATTMRCYAQRCAGCALSAAPVMVMVAVICRQQFDIRGSTDFQEDFCKRNGRRNR